MHASLHDVATAIIIVEIVGCVVGVIIVIVVVAGSPESSADEEDSTPVAESMMETIMGEAAIDSISREATGLEPCDTRGADCSRAREAVAEASAADGAGAKSSAAKSTAATKSSAKSMATAKTTAMATTKTTAMSTAAHRVLLRQTQKPGMPRLELLQNNQLLSIEIS